MAGRIPAISALVLLIVVTAGCLGGQSGGESPQEADIDFDHIEKARERLAPQNDAVTTKLRAERVWRNGSKVEHRITARSEGTRGQSGRHIVLADGEVTKRIRYGVKTSADNLTIHRIDMNLPEGDADQKSVYSASIPEEGSRIEVDLAERYYWVYRNYTDEYLEVLDSPIGAFMTERTTGGLEYNATVHASENQTLSFLEAVVLGVTGHNPLNISRRNVLRHEVHLNAKTDGDDVYSGELLISVETENWSVQVRTGFGFYEM